MINTNSSGAGSFRQAVEDANASPGADSIQFDIPGPGPHDIIFSNLEVTDELHIDGTAGNGGSTCATDSTPALPNIILNINGAWNSRLAFTSSAGGSSLKGISYAKAPQNLILEASNFTTTCSFIDMLPDGTATEAYSGGGFEISANLSNLTFGGPNVADRNYFGRRALLKSDNINNLNFENNFVGVDPTGTAKSANDNSGVLLYLCDNGSDINIVNNVLSGSGGDGIRFSEGNCPGEGDLTSVNIKGNKIGTNKAGDEVLVASLRPGIEIQHYKANTMSDISIGGPNLEDRNIIAGYNSGISTYFNGGPTNNVTIENNYMGVGSNGEALGAPGGDPTIQSYADSHNWLVKNNVISSSSYVEVMLRGDGHQVIGNKIGTNASATATIGSRPSAISMYNNNSTYSGNTIAGFSQAGIMVQGKNNQIKANYIGTDSGLSVNLSSSASNLSAINVAADGDDWFNAENTIIGGTDRADGNYIYNYNGTNNNYLIQLFDSYLSLNSTSVLGNKVIGNGAKPIESFGDPKITNVTESDNDTTFEVELNTDFNDGDYRLEFFSNPTAKNAYDQLETTERVGDVNVTKSGTGSIEAIISGTGYTNPTITATKIDSSSDGYGLTSNVGEYQMSTDLQMVTEDDVDIVQANSSGHEITQTISNHGPSSVTSMVFNLLNSDCFNTTSVATSGTATDAGAFSSGEWSGVLEQGQVLTLTFTGDITCDAGEDMYFRQAVSERYNNGVTVNDTTNENDWQEHTTAIRETTDLQIETTDGLTEIDLSQTDTNEVTQTFTNLGPSTVKGINFHGLGRSCFSEPSVMTSGSATDSGSYSSLAWAGELEPGQVLILTFTSNIECGSGSTLYFGHEPSSYTNNDGDIYEINTGNQDYIDDDTELTVPVADVAVVNTLNNPEDLAIGETLNYTLTFKNNGPADIDLAAFDGTGGNPFATSLFMSIVPFELNFVPSSSTNSNIGCGLFPVNTNDPSASGLFSNYPDHDLINCSWNGDSNILSSGQSVSTDISFVIDGSSDLDFITHLISGWPQYDSDLPTLLDPFQGGQNQCAGYAGILHCYAGTGINNYAASFPVADLRIEKDLVNTGNIKAGDTVNYDITLRNDGPMAIDLSRFNNDGSSLMSEVFPGADLTFIDDNNPNITCSDYGPGSNSFLGAAAEDHPDHQLMTCAFTGSSQMLASGASFTVRLGFTAKSGVSASFTNYVVHASMPTDPDSLIIGTLIGNATEDILDTLTNENFATSTYTSTDTDNDGIPNSVEDAGPNSGDANSDGTLDSLQNHVTSFVNSTTNKRAVLAVSSDCSITVTTVVAESSNVQQDPAYAYPIGLMDFELDCGTPGYTADIAQYYFDASDQDYVVRKYSTNNDNYSDIDSAVITEETVDGQPVLKAVYQITDGSSLDMDNTVDGNIKDPAGLAKAESTNNTDTTESSNNQSNTSIITRLTNNLANTGDSVKILVGAAVLVVALSGIVIVRRLSKGKK